MRLYSIQLRDDRAYQLHQLALAEYRSVQQQAAYLLDCAIEQATRDREAAQEVAVEKEEA